MNNGQCQESHHIILLYRWSLAVRTFLRYIFKLKKRDFAAYIISYLVTQNITQSYFNECLTLIKDLILSYSIYLK